MYNSFNQVSLFGKNRGTEINAGSMADIAFLLLIFFLVTTSLSTDLGILRKLPPPAGEQPPTTIKKRNLQEIWINRDNQVMVRENLVQLSDLRQMTKEFILNKQNDLLLPEKETRNFNKIGNYEITPNHLISLMSDRGTSYHTYIAVQNELTGSYNELREELAQSYFKMAYPDLNASDKQIVDQIYPMHISEAEPKIVE